ncbi:MAG TPA: hypothetical protein PKA21_08445 [Kiritimatiellia bacterium]|nr:hypothetical protein [Kiritimatiellia bacterium]
MLILADTHVHLHAVFDRDTALDAALAHMDYRAAGRAYRGVLCLVDSEPVRSEDRLGESGARQRWRLKQEAEGGAWRAENAAGRILYVLPGRQIISRENLEVLALDCRLTLADRSAGLHDLIDAVIAAGGIPVLPWSFGKWTGRRGRIIEAALHQRRDIVLADNGNRWPNAGEPRLVRLGRDLGLPVWSGSDPLPFPDEVNRLGCCGIRFNMKDDDGISPGQALRRALTDAEVQTYRAPCSFTRFVSAMVKMQARKRLR